MGVQTAIVAVASAAGPLVVGLTVDATDEYLVALALIAAMFAAALALMATHPRRAATVREVEAPEPDPDGEREAPAPTHGG